MKKTITRKIKILAVLISLGCTAAQTMYAQDTRTSCKWNDAYETVECDTKAIKPVEEPDPLGTKILQNMDVSSWRNKLPKENIDYSRSQQIQQEILQIEQQQAQLLQQELHPQRQPLTAQDLQYFHQYRAQPQTPPTNTTQAPPQQQNPTTNTTQALPQPQTPTTNTTQPTPQEYASTETIIADLRKINHDAGERLRVLNEPIKELAQRSPQVELLQSDQLLSTYGIMEQRRALSVLKEVLSIRKLSQDDLRKYEISEFIKIAENNNYSSNIIEIFQSQSKIAALQDSDFSIAYEELFNCIKNVLDFMWAKQMQATIESDGRMGFSSPILAGEYETLILKVNAAKSKTKLVRSREKSISMMTVEVIKNNKQ